MLREGLRAEIPFVFDLAARARRPVVLRMSPALAALGALGARSLTTALALSIQGGSVLAFGVFPFRSPEPITVVAAAVGVAFAFGSARWRGVVAAVSLFALLWIEQFWRAIPGNQLSCERNGTRCDLLASAVAGLWPPLLGIAVGLVAARVVRRGAPGISALAVGVGLTSLAFPIVRLAILPFVGSSPTGRSALEALNWIIAVEALGAAVLGLVVGYFGRWRVADVVLIAMFFVGPWLPQLRTFQDAPRPFIFAIDWTLVTPVLYAAVALLGFAAGSVAARYFATRTPTIP
jgi:hypothetical protein